MKILRILLASPFIAIGFIPLLFGGLCMLCAYRVLTMLPGKKVDETGSMIDIKSLMEMFGGNDNGNKQE